MATNGVGERRANGNDDGLPRGRLGASPPLSKSEQTLNHFTDNALQAQSVNQSYDLHDALKKAADSSSAQEVLAPLRTVLGSLEVLTKVHPFLALAVIPFKAVVSLEIKRRENDRRILVVISQMGDMMSHLCALPQQQVTSFQHSQLQEVLYNVKNQVVECGNAIDVYYKSKLIVKIIKSQSWQDKLENFVQGFSNLRSTLKMKVLLVINSVAGDTNSIVSTTDRKMDQVLKLLHRKTDFEIELSEFIQSHGDIRTAMKSDDFMKLLIAKFEGSAEPGATAGQPDMNRTSASTQDPMRASAASYTPFSPRRQSSTGSAFDNSYSTGYPYPPPASQPYSSYTATPASQPWNSEAYGYGAPSSSWSYLQRRSSLQRASGTSSVSRASTTSTWGSAPSPAGPSTSGYSAATPYPSAPTSSATGYDTRPSSSTTTAGPGYNTSYAYGATRPTSASTQANVPYNPQRTAMRTTVGTRAPEEDVLSPETGVAKPVLVEQYRAQITVALSTELNVMLRRNENLWNFKLGRMTDDIKRHFDSGTNRVLRAITGGPHERLKHGKLKAIWEAEKWRGSIGGMQFLQAVQDFMVDEPQVALAESRNEAWAVRFLGVGHRVPLLQVIDRDCTGFVSIAEANTFTDEKPEGMSLLMWFAYSAVAWAYEAYECRKQIHDLWTHLAQLLETTSAIEAMEDFEATIGPDLDILLSSFRVSPRRIAEIAEQPVLVDILKRRLEARQKNLRENLEVVKWEIDSASTLKAVAGNGFIESYLLPLLSTLIAHFVSYIEAIHTGNHPDALDPTAESTKTFAMKESISMVLSVVDERVFYLDDCYPPEAKSELSFGLFGQWLPKEWPTEPLLPKFASVAGTPITEGPPSGLGMMGSAPTSPLTPVKEEEDYQSPLSIVPTTAGFSGFSAPNTGTSSGFSSPFTTPSSSAGSAKELGFPLSGAPSTQAASNASSTSVNSTHSKTPTPSLHEPKTPSPVPAPEPASAPAPAPAPAPASEPVVVQNGDATPSPGASPTTTLPITPTSPNPISSPATNVVDLDHWDIQNPNDPDQRPVTPPPMTVGEPPVPASTSTGSGTHGASSDNDFSSMAPLFYVEAKYAYQAAEDNDMNLEPGDRIAVIATPESGWWIGWHLNAERDIPGRTTFPSNYVELCDLD
ncbi:hypothetical protein DL93DRAFT_2084553 [Clavulina sp. PMI_390]|nr:hypothetical protein DL93DRAFT_2084553 [Clavulina sp. PMI_390]